MATKVFHGPPGSYKSSTALWFEILPALRSGRVVVTNLQGIVTLEEMQRQLGEIFPNSARLLRISIGNDSGMLLMRNFFHWLPIGAMIFIDEVQDVYPNDKSFKASDYDYKNEGFFNDLLPPEFVDIYNFEQSRIKNNIDIDDYLDDLGESLFDDRDFLRYPRTLRECFMRHRHYNWDILLATPDIKEISGFIRSVCEVAYCHSSKDAIPIPYYKRRPRILEHLPKTNGLSVGKHDIVTFKKVPLDVFKLYKSTATGKNTKSGAGQSPFTFKLYFGFAFIVAYIFYMVFYFFNDDSVKDNKDFSNIATIKTLQDKKDLQQNEKNYQVDNKFDTELNKKIDAITYRDASVQTITSPNNFIGLPFHAKKMYLNGVNTVYLNKHQVTRDYVFTVYIDDEILNVGSETIISMGYKIFFKSHCMVELRADDVSTYIYCEPSRNNQIKESDDKGVSVSLL